MNLRLKTATVVSIGLLMLGMHAVGRASGATAVGGGVVDGPLGLTSQLGFGATSMGGSFQCVMAGRSGGFPFGPWNQVLQMEVHGEVTPGSLTINSDGSATFSGKAFVQVMGAYYFQDLALAFMYLLMLLVLVIRPGGLLGKEE